MKISRVVPLLASMAAQSVNAHTLFSELYIDGQAQGDGTCVRMPDNPNTATDPIASLTSIDMACGVNGTAGVARVCSINSASTLSFEYREWPDDASRGSIDVSHKGPCAVYLKKVSSAISDTAAGDGWFKIWDQGYDESAGKWCTEKIIDNGGHLSVQIPTGLQGGYYLVRPELLALHQADKGDPQFYIGCAQVWLNSTGNELPQSTVSIPGYVGYNQPATAFDIWSNPMALPYPMPGPAVYSPSSSKSKAVSRVNQKQTQGLLPANCVLTNANWAGTELAKYNTESGCWNASTTCWNQCTDCYGTAPPTGSANCKIWEAKCQALDDACNAGNFNGPPDYMKQLSPALKQVSNLPAAQSAQEGDGSYLPATALSAASSSVAAAKSSGATGTTVYRPVSQSTSCTTSATASGSLTVSTDGSCGNGITCLGSSFGDCCSGHGYCGSSSEYCDSGCNSAFGSCGAQKREEHGHAHTHAHRHKRGNVLVGGKLRMMP